MKGAPPTAWAPRAWLRRGRRGAVGGGVVGGHERAWFLRGPAWWAGFAVQGARSVTRRLGRARARTRIRAPRGASVHRAAWRRACAKKRSPTTALGRGTTLRSQRLRRRASLGTARLPHSGEARIRGRPTARTSAKREEHRRAGAGTPDLQEPIGRMRRNLGIGG